MLTQSNCLKAKNPANRILCSRFNRRSIIKINARNNVENPKSDLNEPFSISKHHMIREREKGFSIQGTHSTIGENAGNMHNMHC